MEPLDYYLDFPVKTGDLISFFNKDLEQYKVPHSNSYKFILDLQSIAIFVTCIFLRKSYIKNKETLDFVITEVGASK
ncbi:MAG: hypothetical protein JWR09_3623 [Mucilaginibacter sp.]|nr:hypothetical protein [Mucilaginibacter sp.]